MSRRRDGVFAAREDTSMSMIPVEATSVLQAPRQQAFAFITDVTNWPRYWPDFVRIEAPAIPDGRRRAIASPSCNGCSDERWRCICSDEFRPDVVRHRSRQAGLPYAIHERHFTRWPGVSNTAWSSPMCRAGWRGLFDRMIFKRAVERALHKTIGNLRSEFASAR